MIFIQFFFVNFMYYVMLLSFFSYSLIMHKINSYFISYIYIFYNIFCIKRHLKMDPNAQKRKKMLEIRNSLKQKLINSGHLSNNAELINDKSVGASLQIQRNEKPSGQVQTNQSQVPEKTIGRTRRKTSLDIRMLGDKFDMFECNQVYIFNQFNEMYDIINKIDEGAQSVVYQAKEKTTGSQFAVKVIKSKDQDIIQSLKTHFRILKNVDHPNVIKAYHLFINERFGINHLVLQYSSFPNLRFHLLKNRILKQCEAAQILASVLQVIAHLHLQGICHRDIKPQNILFNPNNGQIKLIDFQISKMIKYGHMKLQMMTNTGTLYYRAPESFNSGYYTEQVDIWAIGVLCYQMIYGDYPFRKFFANDTIRLIKQSQPKYDTSNATDLCINFIKKCLQKDPLKRFTACEALKSPFILKYSSISSTNSSPMRRKNSQQYIRGQFGIQVNKCFDQDSRLKNKESLQIDNGIRVVVHDNQ